MKEVLFNFFSGSIPRTSLTKSSSTSMALKMKIIILMTLLFSATSFALEAEKTKDIAPSMKEKIENHASRIGENIKKNLGRDFGHIPSILEQHKKELEGWPSRIETFVSRIFGDKENSNETTPK